MKDEKTCEICGGDLRVGKMVIADVAEFDICVWCHEDEAKLKEWFVREMETALEQSPDFRKLPDGKWVSV